MVHNYPPGKWSGDYRDRDELTPEQQAESWANLARQRVARRAQEAADRGEAGITGETT